MGEGSVTRQGDGCCSIVWFWRVLADSQSWCAIPWWPDQGGGVEYIWLPDQSGGIAKVWLPDQGKETGEVGGDLGLPSQGGRAGEVWLPDHLLGERAWVPSSILYFIVYITGQCGGCGE